MLGAALLMGLVWVGNGQAEAASERQPPTLVVKVRAEEYRFIPSAIEVRKGSTVTIQFTNGGTERHEFELEAFDAEIEPIAPGQTASLTFVADKAGTFEYACHVDGHYEKGMKGHIIVK